MIPLSFEILPISAIGCMLPTTLFACIMLISIVLSFIAFSTSFGLTTAFSSTGIYVTLYPTFSKYLHVFLTAGCSIEDVIM